MKPKRTVPARPPRSDFRAETVESRILFSADTALAAALATPVPLVVAQAPVEAEPVAGVPADASTEVARQREIVIINADVPDKRALLADIAGRGEGAPQVFVLDEAGAQATLARLGEILRGTVDTGGTPLSAVHLISHGADGELSLGGERITTLDLLAKATDIVAWRDAFSDDADFLLYGCDVAASSEGRNFVDTLARLTGTDVAASDDVTGASARGGDWRLEYRSGDVAGKIVVSEALRSRYEATLATYTVTDFGDSGVNTLRWAIEQANAGGGDDTIAFGGAGTITLATALPRITDTVTIDATTVPGYIGVPMITLDGSATTGENGLHFDGANSDGSQVRGLAIVGFDQAGILLENSGNHVISGNRLGTDASGPNGNLNGVRITDGHHNLIGGTTAAEANTIRSNGGAGIAVTGATSIGNAFLRNVIADNGAQGIDLGASGVDPNDAQDADGGPNGLQNHPVLTQVGTDGAGAVAIRGTIDSTPGTSFRVDAYASATADPSGHGEAERHLGTFLSSTDGTGAGAFDKTLSATLSSGEFVSATLTSLDAGGVPQGTSEFSANAVVVSVIINEAPTFGRAVTPTFTDHVISTDANGTALVTSADVDGDGDVDVLAASPHDDKIVWYENDGSQNFTARIITASANYATSVSTADVDGDGDLDVLSALSNSDNSIAWYENDGSQNFTARPIGNNVGTLAVITADVDGDGDLDVLSNSSNSIAWYENDGSQNFTFRIITTTTSSEYVTSVSTADVDGDGDVDVLSASFLTDKIVWYENDGSQGFTARTITTGADGASSVSAADVDGDGDVDVLSASSNDDKIAWYENDGSQNFTARTLTTSADGARSVTTADVDGDGDVDVLSASRYDNTIAWYENDGAQNFTAHSITNFANGATFVTTADVDGDGDVDVLSASGLDDKIAWYENTGGQVDTLDATPTYTEDGAAVVLDADVAVFDAELSGADAFDGASVTLVRDTGANAEDRFSAEASGTLGALVTGGALVVGGTSIGTVTTNAGGTLVLSFDANATNARVDQALRQIAYENTSDAPPASVTIGWTFDDGNSGAQGSGGAGQVTGSTTVTIIATDDGPVISSDGGGATATVSVSENQVAVTTVTSTDVDGGPTPVYSLSGGTNQAAFAISSSSGELTFLAAPDRETQASYEVVVAVSDGVATDTQALTVTITDQNDNAPTIISDGGGATATVSVSENQTAVTTVTSTDADTGPAPAYSLSGGADQAAFAIDTDSGELTFLSAPDREVQTSYEVQVSVSDGVATDSQTLTVTVTDQNDNAPIISSDGGGATATVSASENQTAVTTVTSTDADTGPAPIYSLSGGADETAFAIDANSGELTFLSAPDRETQASYEVVVAVSDGVATDSQTIMVILDDQNDNTPEISSDGGEATATVSVSENQVEVTTVTSTDADTGPAPTYSLSGGADETAFAIDASSGELTFLAAPNRETQASYEVEVAVSDGVATDTQALTITITDQNDNAPVISSDGGGATATVSVSENQVAVTTVTSTDADSGPAPVYSLSGGADRTAFAIDGGTGELTFANAPDREAQASYEVQVSVSDGVATDSQTLTVTVTDQNDNAPVISSDGGGATATVSASENQTAVTTVTSTDADTGPAPIYSLSGGADETAFAIDSGTGELTFADAPDRETQASYEVQVSVSDGVATDSQMLTVTITDQNDNAPVISSDGGGATATVSVSENQTAVTTVTSTDADSGPAPIYSLSGGADETAFAIDSGTGELTFLAAPDRETQASYEVEVAVSDGVATDTQALTVTITDQNDNAPVIGSDGGEATATVSVSENQVEVTTVTSTDADTGPAPTYSLSGGADETAFAIDASSGELTFLSAPDRETQDSYEVVVAVSDGVATDTQALTVTITDQNDNAPVISSDGGGVTATLLASENQVAVTTVTSTDADTGPAPVYSLSGGADQTAFAIDADSGELTFVTAPDRETQASYEVVVAVSDGVATDTQALTVTITDQNDNAPVIGSDGGEATATVSVSENQVEVTTVTSTDADTGPAPTYSLSGGADETAFAIDASSGELTFLSASDRETQASYEVQVSVSDGVATDSQTLTVTVTDQNDNAPVISSDGGGATATVSVSENQTAVTTVTSTDADTGPAPVYSLSGGADQAAFAIDADSGELTFVTAPDRETQASYEVQVSVSDGVATDSQTLTVTVTDQNDNAPVISSDGGGATATVSVSENQVAVTTVISTDADTGPAPVYSLSGGADRAAFAIDADSGELTFVTAPDRETQASYEVQVSVSDGVATDSQTLTVTVTDQNDNAPVISSDGGGATATVSVSENQVAVTTVTSTDADTGPAPVYSLSGGADRAAFAIDADSGELTFVTAPDRETQASYEVVVAVSDGVATDTQALTVTITDQNDNAPVISSDGGGATATVSVSENQVAVTTVTSTDADTGPAPTYSLSGGADETAFAIDSGTGELTFVTAPDRETQASYEVVVAVSDGVATDTQALTVTITDQNDNAPVISSDGGGATATVSVSENQTAVTTVTSTDADTGPAPTYSLSGGADETAFAIDGGTGELTFADAPDRETQASYEVQVSVSDGVATDSQMLTVTITDQNDNAPVIGSDGGEATATVSASENQTAVTTVTSTDADTGPAPVYSLSGGADQAAFAIDASSGELTFLAAPNRETQASYEVEVAVSDGVATDTQALTVTITDQNDNAPVISSDGGGVTATLLASENQVAVTTVTSTDADTGPAPVYSLSGGADETAFAIDGGTGELTFVNAPDRETQASYEVQVSASDGVATDSQTITVTITDQNDNAPVISSDGGGATATVSVGENQTAVTTVTSTDADTGPAPIYSLSGGADQTAFAIDADSGELTFLAAPDRETQDSYEVQVSASDGVATDSQTITVTITDQNDNAPVISSDGGGATATVSVGENQTAVTTVTSTDADTGPAPIYSLSGGADQTAFAIDADSGELTFLAAPDRETQDSYEVQVSVSDGVATDSQTITVTVTDQNDNAPVISSDGGGATATVSVSENQTAVTTVTSTDADTGPAPVYSLSGGADQTTFAIDGGTGELTFVTAPDREVQASYEVQVSVSDGVATDSQTITVTITDENDNAPVISSDGGGATATVSVSENQVAVTTVTSTDADTGPVPTYSLSGGADQTAFAIDADSGELTFVTAPDRETQDSYEVVVAVSDGVATDTQALTVTITDQNDNAPVISSDGGGATATVSVSENQTAVTTVTSTDTDTGPAPVYSLSGGADQTAFAIDADSGELTFLTAPDRETQDSYEVVVAVSDGVATDSQTIMVILDDQNDNTPVISSDGGDATATVSVGENQVAVTTVTSTDADTGPAPTYSLSGGADETAFAIDGGTGELTFVNAPDRETQASYEVQVSVSDGVAMDNQAITVTIVDQNDNAPVISSNGGGATATVSASENQVAVTTVTSTDTDTGPAPVYSLSGGADQTAFAIDADSGELTFLAAPDRETQDSYEVQVSVSDGVATDSQTITVTVTDQNDNAPVISSDGGGATATVSVGENQVAVTTVTSTDADTGPAPVYSLSGGADQTAFAIDADSGELTFLAAPDRETQASYEVQVSVSDGVATDSQTLTVTITDENDNAPVISSDGGGATATVSVSENQTAVTTVTSTDTDTGPAPVYSLSGGADQAAFAIDGGTGELTFANAPDRETQASYEVQVSVSDGVATDSQTLTVTITDENDNAPVISSDGGGATATVSVSENQVAVTTVTSTDADTGPAPVYSLSGGADQTAFAIDGGTGELTFVSAPDREVQASHEVVVTVSDGVATDSQTITVTLDDQNDNAPIITSDGGEATATATVPVSENQMAVTTVTSTDADTGPAPIYSLSGGADQTAFAIDSGTGELTFVNVPDRETQTSYEVVVAVSDGVAIDTQTLTVTITDQNDNAPIITSDGGGATATVSVSENQTAVTTVTSTDADTGPAPVYSLSGGADQAAFAIDASSGELTFLSAPDRETQASHEVEVSVGDGAATGSQTITVILVDENDNAPSIVAGQRWSVDASAAGGAEIGRVQAQDIDTVGSLSGWRMDAGEGRENFVIDPLTGVLRVADGATLDGQERDVYEIVVSVSDGPNRSSPESIGVFVTGIDEAPGAVPTPIAAREDIALAIDPTADMLSGVTGSDPNSLRLVSFEQPEHGSLVMLESGLLEYRAEPDFNGQDGFGYVAVDESGRLIDGRAIVAVEAVNDPPALTIAPIDAIGASMRPIDATMSPGSALFVAENESGIGRVWASDAEGGTVEFALAGRDASLFEIDRVTGELSAIDALDFETSRDADGDNRYELTVVMWDEEGVQVRVPLTVSTTNVNEAPVFSGVAFSLTEGQAGSLADLGRLEAHDPDSGDELVFQLLADGDAPSESGITLSPDGRLLDVDLPPGVHEFNIRVTDAGGLFADGVLTIRVEKSLALVPPLGRALPSVPTIDIEIPELARASEPELEIEPAMPESDPVDAPDPPPVEESTEATSVANTFGRAPGLPVPGVYLAGDPMGRAPAPDDPGRGQRSASVSSTIDEPVVTVELLRLSIPGFDVQDFVTPLSEELFAALQRMDVDVDRNEADEDARSVMFRGGAMTIGTTLSVGYLIWLMRSGALLATALLTSPLWRPFDPIPILASGLEKDDDDDGSVRDAA